MLTCPNGHGESATGGQSCSLCGAALVESGPAAPVAPTAPVEPPTYVPPPAAPPVAPPPTYAAAPPTYGAPPPTYGAPPPAYTAAPPNYGYAGQGGPAPTMGFTEAVQTVLHKYADFSGRARRSEYWWWALAYGLTAFVCFLLILGVHALGLILYLLVVLGALVPNLAVAVRRLHDTDKSGWWLLIALVPFVGGIILLVFMVMDGTPGPNQYGYSPKG